MPTKHLFRLFCAIAVVIAWVPAAIAQTGSAARTAITQGLIAQADLNRARRLADDSQANLIREYEAKIGGYRSQLATFAERERQAHSLTHRERQRRLAIEAELNEVRSKLARLAERIASKDAEWSAEREGFRAQIARQVAQATPEMLAELQRFADGDRVEANRRLEYLEGIRMAAQQNALRMEQIEVLRGQVQRRKIMWGMLGNQEMGPLDVAAKYAEIVALAPDSLDDLLSYAQFLTFGSKYTEAHAALDLAAVIAQAEPARLRLCSARFYVLDQSGELQRAFDQNQSCLAAARGYAEQSHDTKPLRRLIRQIERAKSYRGEQRRAVRLQLYEEGLGATRGARTAFASEPEWRSEVADSLRRACGERAENSQFACLLEVLENELLASSVQWTNGLRIGIAIGRVLEDRACRDTPRPECGEQVERVLGFFQSANYFRDTQQDLGNDIGTAMQPIAEWQSTNGQHARAAETLRTMLANVEPIEFNPPSTYFFSFDASEGYSELAESLAAAGDPTGAIAVCDAKLGVERRVADLNAATPDSRSGLAFALTENSDCHSLNGDQSGSLVPLRHAVAVRRSLIGVLNGDADELELLLLDLEHLSEIEQELGNQQAATRLIEEALAKRQALAFGPSDANGNQAARLIELQLRRADRLAEGDQPTKAKPWYLKALANLDRLAGLPGPKQARRIAKLGDRQWEYADFLDDLEDHSGGDAAAAQALESARRAAAMAGEGQLDRRFDLARRLTEFGERRELRNDPGGALSAYAEALAELTALSPIEDAGISELDIADLHLELGRLKSSSGSTDAAVDDFAAAYAGATRWDPNFKHPENTLPRLNEASRNLVALYLKKSDLDRMYAIAVEALKINERYFVQFPTTDKVVVELLGSLLLTGTLDTGLDRQVDARARLRRCIEISGRTPAENRYAAQFLRAGDKCRAQLAQVGSQPAATTE